MRADANSPLGRIRHRAVLLDRSPWLFIAVLALLPLVATQIQLNLPPGSSREHQVRRLNPDAKLYLGLAENLHKGGGYRDTVRSQETLPSIGHPLLLAVVCGQLGLTPARQAWLGLWLSILFLALAAQIYCRSNLLALLAAGLFGAYLRGIVWRVGNVETSIVLTHTLLLLGLAIFYRSGFRNSAAVAAGVSLSAALLVRPIYLYVVQLAAAGAVAALAVYRFRPASAPPPRMLRGWSVLLLTAVALVATTSGYSRLQYGDSRLVSGTYGAWPLYLANNPHSDPARLFRIRKDETEIGRMLEYFNRTGWEERHVFFMGEVMDYWRDQPARALHGWLWRLQRFTGFHARVFKRVPHVDRWGPRAHPYLVIIVLLLLGVRLASVWRTPGRRLGRVLSLGTVATLAFGLYAAIHSLFPYTGFRYVAGCTTTLSAAIVFLVAEVAGTAAPVEPLRRGAAPPGEMDQGSSMA